MSDLSHLRRAVDTSLSVFLWAHVPVIGLAAFMGGNASHLIALCLTAAALASVATAFRWAAPGAGNTRLTIGVALVGMISTLLAALSGTAWQADMHMYYFAALAILSAYCDRRVILAAAAATAVHHLALNFAVPLMVFPGGASLARVILHAVIVILETASLVWIVGRIQSALSVSEAAMKTAESHRAKLEEAMAAEAAGRQQVEIVRRQTMQKSAADVESGLGDATAGLVEAAGCLSNVAITLSQGAESTALEAGSALQAAATTTWAVQSVAAAVEELTASMNEISAQIHNAAQRAATAKEEVAASSLAAQSMAAEAGRISDVVSLIEAIASRTNLLALNATIEAARAGDAGHGFAVVAGEVKALAMQTAAATKQIQHEIGLLQAGTARSVTSIGSITQAVNAMDQVTVAVASAVEQQQSATQEIARSIGSAADSVEQVKQAIAGVAGATDATRDMANQVIQAGERVNGLSNTISDAASAIVVKLRA